MEDRVWFTYKARIQAQMRLSWLDFHSQILLVWYALLGASLAIVTIRYPHALGENTDIFSAVLSVALLSLSMVVANRDFKGRSMAMRQNYLDLQNLHAQIKQHGSATPAHSERYHELLSLVENHAEIDDKMFRVLNSGGLTSRHPSCVDKLEVYIYLIIRVITLFGLYVAPLILWWML